MFTDNFNKLLTFTMQKRFSLWIKVLFSAHDNIITKL